MPCLERSTGDFPAAWPPQRGFDDAPVDNDVVELEADDLVVGLEAQVLQAGEDASGDPLIAATAHGGGRAGGIGDLVVGGAQHEYLDELVEHEPIRDPGPVAAQGDGDRAARAAARRTGPTAIRGWRMGQRA